MIMKKKFTFSLFFALFLSGIVYAQDVIVIPGGPENQGKLETTINGDVNADGTRKNPNRIYELEADKFYFQNAPINVDNVGGTLTIRGQEGGSKPVIIKVRIDDVEVTSNTIKGNLTLQNIQYQNMGANDVVTWVNEGQFLLPTPHCKLVVEDCFFENTHQHIFGTPDGTPVSKYQFRNNYFRDLNDLTTSWWGGRVFMAKCALDTLIFENNTTTGSALALLNQQSLTDFAIINHNTFINSIKYVAINQYYREVYFTNNLFVNGNMSGEDLPNIVRTQQPDKFLSGISGLDTISTDLFIQDRYVDGDGNLTSEVDEISDYIYYAADNVVTYSNTLDEYYNGNYDDDFPGEGPASYVNWFGGDTPYLVYNVPGIWLNDETKALIDDNSNLVDENNKVYNMTVAELGMIDPLPQAAADVFIQWNSSEYGNPGETKPADNSAFYFGDHIGMTIPGVEGENSTKGITKVTDLREDFSYTSTQTSKSDGERIGALHWNDETLDYDASLAAIKSAYEGAATSIRSNKMASFDVSVYPNPTANMLTVNSGREVINAKIISTTGKEVKNIIVENKKQFEINVQDLTRGLYIIQIGSAENVVTKKFIKE